jgi:hypothetical protein
MRNVLAEDILAGHGVTLVDPHGQLVEDLLENHIPRRRRWSTRDATPFGTPPTACRVLRSRYFFHLTQPMLLG